VRTSRFRWLSVVVFALPLLGLGGLSGCDSKPSDGSQIADSGSVAPEQQTKVEQLYKNRHTPPAKPKAR
jgi:hypothetical protein